MYERIGGLVIAALVILASATAGVAAAPTAPSSASTGPASVADAAAENESADTAYVTEDGDVVLVYEEASSGDAETTGQLGVDMSSGLIHMLFESPVEGQTEVTGQATFEVTPDGLSGTGDFVATKPEAIESLQVDVSGEQTDQNAALDATFSATVAGGGSYYSSMETEGTATVGPDQFTSSGSYTLTVSQEYGQSSAVDTHRAISIAETPNGYDLHDDRRQVITEWSKARWDSRENATQTLEQQFQATAQQFGGSAAVTITSYDFQATSQEGQYVLDISYRVELTGVKEGINDQLTTYLAQSEEIDLSQSEAEQISTRLQEVQIQEVSFATATAGRTTTTEWNIDIRNYGEAVHAMLDAAEHVEAEDVEITQEQIDQARTTIEAQQAADLTQQITWSGGMSAGSAGQQYSGEVHYSTQNWAAYVSELESRGIENGEFTFELTASSSGDEIQTELSVSVSKEDMLEDATNQLLNSAETDQETRDFLEAFQNSEFQKAKVQVRVEEDQVILEAGAKFENIEAMKSAFNDTYAGSSDGQFALSGVLVEDDGQTQTTYVRITNVADGEVTEEDVRALEGVDSETEIKMPGEWDRDFPEMDTADASDFLGVETPTPTPTETTDSPDSPDDGEDSDDGDDGDDGDGGNDGATPGFGFGAAVVAALAGAALLARRN